MNNIPNIISVSRGIAAIVMLLFPAFSSPFWILYCWCGFSDMIDGTLPRNIKAIIKALLSDDNIYSAFRFITVDAYWIIISWIVLFVARQN